MPRAFTWAISITRPGTTPTPGYDYEADVVYPFGHGLSYTTFDKKIMAMNEENGVITVRVEVKNTGSMAGKDVIELYCTPPLHRDHREVHRQPGGLQKTNLIQPGETEYYSLEIPVEDLASYDYKVNGCYVLEKGNYVLSLRSDSHTVVDENT